MTQIKKAVVASDWDLPASSSDWGEDVKPVVVLKK